MIWRIYLQKARNANAVGDIKKAFFYMEKMLKFNPSVNAKVLYGYYLLKKGKTNRAKEVFEKHIMCDKRVLRKEKTNKKGLKVLNRNELSAKTNYALVLWKSGDLDGAISMLEYVQSKIKTTDLYCNLGLLYALKGDLDKALQYNLKAYDYAPQGNGICDNLGYTYYLREEYDKALEIYEEIMGHEKQPGFPDCWYNYGCVLQKLQRYDEAKQMYEKALECEFTGFSNVSKEDVLKNLEQMEQIQP